MKIFGLMAALVLGISVQAQKMVEFPKEVNLIKMTDAGVAVVGTDDALYGMSSEGELLWSNEKLRKVEAERVEVLSGSELVFVSDKGMLARNRVLNVLTGEEYANREIKGENIFAATVLHGVNQLWVCNSPTDIQVWDIDKNEHLYDLEKKNFPYGLALNKMASLTSTFLGTQVPV
jgi:hypothetical protein